MIHERTRFPRNTQTYPRLTPRYLRVAVVVGFWLILIGGFYWQARSSGLSVADALQHLASASMHTIFGPLIFIAVASFSPLVLFPAGLLGIVAGFVFGPAWGLLYTLIGCNISASVAYIAGRFCGFGLTGNCEQDGRFARYSSWLRENEFTAVLALRLMFLPYDPINYCVGMLRLRWSVFILANTLGCLPGALALVLFGASIERFDGVQPQFDPWVLMTSLALLVVSIGLAIGVKRYQKKLS